MSEFSLLHAVFRVCFVGFGVVTVVYAFTREPKIRWGGGRQRLSDVPFHAMRPWERAVTVLFGLVLLLVGVFVL
jgi:hypothetical protein